MKFILAWECSEDYSGCWEYRIPIEADSAEEVYEYITELCKDARKNNKMHFNFISSRGIKVEFNCDEFEDGLFKVYTMKEWFQEEGVYFCKEENQRKEKQ